MLSLSQRNDCSAPAAGFGRRVVEACDEGRAGQDGANHFALHSDATAVNDAKGFEPQTVRFGEIFLDYRHYITWSNGVQIEDVGDGVANGVLRFFHASTIPAPFRLVYLHAISVDDLLLW